MSFNKNKLNIIVSHSCQQKLMTLTGEEFLRRFCLHILPPRFIKIRHYGFLASRVKPALRMQQMTMGVLVQNQAKQNWKDLAKAKLNYDVDACPCCKAGRMIRIQTFEANAPPRLDLLKINLWKTTK